MSPEQIAALTAIASILSKAGTWPLFSIFVSVILTPWIILGLSIRSIELRRVAENKRAEDSVNLVLTQYRKDVNDIKKLYENNVDLVKNYEIATKQWEKLDGDLAGIITLNTQILTRLVEKVDNNTFCPQVRAAGPKR